MIFETFWHGSNRSIRQSTRGASTQRSRRREGTCLHRAVAKCHGDYGKEGTYPNRFVSQKLLGTDPVRYQSLSDEHRANFQHGWFGSYNQQDPVFIPNGYIAPPLDGIWASAPYLHNGSVPTLWHLLHPDARPKLWTRTENGYDQNRVGLQIQEFDAIPESVQDPVERRHFFDTTRRGKSAAGHRFPDELNEAEKNAVLEYLKTL